jgi:hypothetical protein
MGQIYTSAKEGGTWLGEEEDRDIAIAFEVLRRFCV